MKHSLQYKLLYRYMAVVVLLLVGVSLGISVLLREYFLASKQQELADKGREIARNLAGYQEGRVDIDQLNAFLDTVDSFIGARIWILDGSRRLVAVSMQDCLGIGPGRKGHGPGMGGMMKLSLQTDLDPVYAGQVVTQTLKHPYYGEDMLLVGVPIHKADGTIGGAVLLHSPVKGMQEFLWQIYVYIGGIGLAALALTVVVVRRLASGITSPLRSMQESAAAMARGNYDSRVPITTEDEVGDLGRSLNALAQELERFVAQTSRLERLRREFLANVSHELKTPLTLIRGFTEALLDGTADSKELIDRYHGLIRDETDRLERLISEVLDLSRLQGETAQFALEALPLAAVVGSVAQMIKPRAEQNGVTVNLELADVTIRGNGDRITQLLLILLDNALKFTPSGGTVAVNLRREGDAAVLSVADSGVGIAPEDLPYIWERFYKADKAHSREKGGTGLGLAIAREILNRHEASAEVQSEPGHGTTFTMRFPTRTDWLG